MKKFLQRYFRPELERALHVKTRLTHSGRLLAGHQGRLPNFIILGAQKSGTTSLFHSLMQFPGVVQPITKEVHYFDYNWREPEAWYRAFFPDEKAMEVSGAITGECSPSYLAHPHVPARIKKLLPDARLVIVLRDPVRRAFSHFRHMVRKRRERRCPFTILERYDSTREGVEQLMHDPHRDAKALLDYAYIHRGLYHDQLRRYFESFDAAQIIILEYGELLENPKQSVSAVADHLGLRFEGEAVLEHRQEGDMVQMPEELEEALGNLFRPHNVKLFELIGRSYDWIGM